MIPLRDVIPSRTTPYVTISLVTINILVFLYQFSLGPAVNQFVLAFGLVPAYFSWVNVVHVDVPPRRLPARGRQHALSLDLRRQRRGPHGTRAVSGVLPALRHGGGPRANADGSRLRRPDGRRQRRGCGRHGRLLRALPAFAHRHAAALFIFIQIIEVPAIFFLGHLVRDAVAERRRVDCGSDGRRARRVASPSGRTSRASPPASLGVFVFRRPQRQRVEWWNDVDRS